MSLVAVQPGAEWVRINGSKPWINVNVMGLFKQGGSWYQKNVMLFCKLLKTQRRTKSMHHGGKSFLWIQNDESEWMTQQDTSQICGI